MNIGDTRDETKASEAFMSDQIVSALQHALIAFVAYEETMQTMEGE